MAIGAGALRSCVIPNKRTNGAELTSRSKDIRFVEKVRCRPNGLRSCVVIQPTFESNDQTYIVS